MNKHKYLVTVKPRKNKKFTLEATYLKALSVVLDDPSIKWFKVEKL